tara:strand:- start:255 stop:773 length:519 start_codon:yes stop_codon:yes gene_type:complete
MFLDGWKQYSLKRKLQKSVENSTSNHFDSGNTQQIGIVFDARYVDKSQMLALVQDVFKGYEVQLFGFSNTKNSVDLIENTSFSIRDFTVFGGIKNEALNIFLAKPFNILISYYDRENVFLQFVTSQSKASFKVGLPVDDSGINDLTISTDLDDITLFKSELVKYLKILKRIY